MFDMKFDAKIDTPKAAAVKEIPLSLIPKTDCFRKPRLRKGVPDRDSQEVLQSACIDDLGIPYLVHQVTAYALAYAAAQDVTYITKSLCLAIAKEIGIDTENILFNKKTFLQQFTAQHAYDKRMLSVACSDIDSQKEFQVYVPASDSLRDSFESCISYC